MRIYIRTPLANKSKMIPHTVEHCAGNIVGEIPDFFDFQWGISGGVSTDFTYFEFDKWVKYEDIMKYLFQPIEKKSVDYEHKVLKEELGDSEYAQKLYEKVMKKFIDPEISTNQYKSVSWEDVKKYQEKYYKPENAIVVDEEKDYKVIFKGFNPEKKKCKKLEKRKEKFRFKNSKYIAYILKQYNGEDYRRMFFSYRLLNYYLYLVNRLTNQEYFHQYNYFFEDTYACIALVEDKNYSKLDQEFFEGGKKYFLNVIKHGYYQEEFFLNEYIYGIPKTRKEVIEIIKNFSREEFKEFLELK